MYKFSFISIWVSIHWNWIKIEFAIFYLAHWSPMFWTRRCLCASRRTKQRLLARNTFDNITSQFLLLHFQLMCIMKTDYWSLIWINWLLFSLLSNSAFTNEQMNVHVYFVLNIRRSPCAFRNFHRKSAI